LAQLKKQIELIVNKWSTSVGFLSNLSGNEQIKARELIVETIMEYLKAPVLNADFYTNTIIPKIQELTFLLAKGKTSLLIPQHFFNQDDIMSIPAKSRGIEKING